MSSLQFLIAVSLWCLATCQEQSLQLGLSVSTVSTNREVSTSVTEGGSLRICFDPTATPTTASVVSVKTKDGTAVAPGDYTALETDLTFTDADAQCVWFYANLDVEDEGSETFTIEASGTSGDYSNVNIEVTVTINNQDLQGPSFSVEYDNYPVTESAGEVEVCVAYYGTQSLASSATVQLRTLDNPMFPGQSPASAGSDYTPQSGDFTFPANTVSGTRECITIKITDDSTDESEETIQIQLTSPSGATLGPHTSATVRITETQTVVPVTVGGNSGGADGNSGGVGGNSDSVGEGRNGMCSTHNPYSLLSLLTLGLAVAMTVLNTQ